MQNEHELLQRLTKVEAALDRQQQERQEATLSRFRAARMAPYLMAHAEFQRECASLPHPKRYPAALRDFYRLIVRARDKAENQPRFKRFLRSIYQEVPREEERDSQVEQSFQRYQQHGFSADWQWEPVAGRYLRWWAKEKADMGMHLTQATTTGGGGGLPPRSVV